MIITYDLRSQKALFKARLLGNNEYNRWDQVALFFFMKWDIDLDSSSVIVKKQELEIEIPCEIEEVPKKFDLFAEIAIQTNEVIYLKAVIGSKLEKLTQEEKETLLQKTRSSILKGNTVINRKNFDLITQLLKDRKDILAFMKDCLSNPLS